MSIDLPAVIEEVGSADFDTAAAMASQAQALRSVVQQHEDAAEKLRQLALIRLESERRMGEFLLSAEKVRPADQSKQTRSSKRVRPADQDKRRANEYRQLARVDRVTWKTWRVEALEAGKPISRKAWLRRARTLNKTAPGFQPVRRELPQPATPLSPGGVGWKQHLRWARSLDPAKRCAADAVLLLIEDALVGTTRRQHGPAPEVTEQLGHVVARLKTARDAARAAVIAHHLGDDEAPGEDPE